MEGVPVEDGRVSTGHVSVYGGKVPDNAPRSCETSERRGGLTLTESHLN